MSDKNFRSEIIEEMQGQVKFVSEQLYKYADTVFDAEAREWALVCEDPLQFRIQLHELRQRTVDEIPGKLKTLLPPHLLPVFGDPAVEISMKEALYWKLTANVKKWRDDFEAARTAGSTEA